jgi:PBP1b-binding outer membrane lipoprotein LpoB
MKINQLLFIALIAFLFVGCNKDAAVEPQIASPTDTLKSFIQSSKQKDVEAIKKVMSKNSLTIAERSAQLQNTTVDELFKRDNPALPTEIPEIRNEKIEGETATVEVKDQTSGYETIPFVKEDGVWKIAFDKYQQAMMEKMRKEMGDSESNRSKPDGAPQSNAPSNKTDAPSNKSKANKQ